jgi:hypothetical protein
MNLDDGAPHAEDDQDEKGKAIVTQFQSLFDADLSSEHMAEDDADRTKGTIYGLFVVSFSYSFVVSRTGQNVHCR